MPEPTSFHTIGELARLAGVTPRTIRYYVAQGLLPAPGGSGPGAHYGERHLERLRLIKRLQRQHLPLAEIRSQLGSLTDEEVAELDRAGAASAPSDSALDYIRSLLGPLAGSEPSGPAAPTPPAPARARRVAMLSRPAAHTPGEPKPAAVVSEARAIPVTREVAQEASTRSQWERLSLGPNLELHIRRPLSRLEQRRVERLITIARQVLKEETP